MNEYDNLLVILLASSPSCGHDNEKIHHDD